jgi:hypothetical protein
VTQQFAVQVALHVEIWHAWVSGITAADYITIFGLICVKTNSVEVDIRAKKHLWLHST